MQKIAPEGRLTSAEEHFTRDLEKTAAFCSHSPKPVEQTSPTSPSLQLLVRISFWFVRLAGFHDLGVKAEDFGTPVINRVRYQLLVLSEVCVHRNVPAATSEAKECRTRRSHAAGAGIYFFSELIFTTLSA